MDYLLSLAVAEREANRLRARLAVAKRWADTHPERFTADELSRLSAEHDAARANLATLRTRELAGRK